MSSSSTARHRVYAGSGRGAVAGMMVTMWVFLTRRLRLWLFFALGAPVLGWLLGKIGDGLEARNGPTRASRTLQQGRNWLQRRSRGPFANRGARF